MMAVEEINLDTMMPMSRIMPHANPYPGKTGPVYWDSPVTGHMRIRKDDLPRP